MTSRLIDVTIHDLTAPQAVVVLINHFVVSTSQPVVLMTRKGKVKDMVAKMRTELTRYRERNPNPTDFGDRQMFFFGFKVSTEIPLEFKGVDGFREAVALHFNVTPLQNIKNMAAEVASKESWA